MTKNGRRTKTTRHRRDGIQYDNDFEKWIFRFFESKLTDLYVRAHRAFSTVTVLLRNGRIKIDRVEFREAAYLFCEIRNSSYNFYSAAINLRASLEFRFEVEEEWNLSRGTKDKICKFLFYSMNHFYDRLF